MGLPERVQGQDMTKHEEIVKPNSSTQNSRILRRLLETPNTWIPMPELAKVGSGKKDGFCMVHSRISDLRKTVHVIENEIVRIGKSNYSFYRLVLPSVKVEGDPSK